MKISEDYQGGQRRRVKLPGGQGEKLRLSESPLDSRESSIQLRLLMKMGSVDLMICQEAAVKASHIAKWAGMDR
jgi:hypothetical protein